MKVKLGEWEKNKYRDGHWHIDTPIGVIEVEKRYNSNGYGCGVMYGDEVVLGWYPNFATADEAKAFIISEYEKLVLSLIEVE